MPALNSQPHHLTSFVTSVKLLKYCFLTCKIRIMMVRVSHCVVRALHDLTFGKFLEQCLVYRKIFRRTYLERNDASC